MPKSWLITGSSRGLGRTLAEAVLAAGGHLTATARDPRSLDGLVERYGGQVRAVALDVTDAAAAEAAVQAAVAAFGRLDVVVNNAGYANLGSIEDTAAEDFRAQVETNLFGVVNVSRAALPVMRAQGEGHIIQVSSIGGRIGTPGLAAYQAAKWAVGGFSEVLAQEVNPLGIRVTVLEPGGMPTDWAGASMTIHPVSEPYQGTVGALAGLFEQGRQAARSNPEPRRRGSDPAKVAQVILHLAGLAEPPLRLVLGADAFRMATATSERRAAEDERWKELSLSTEFVAALTPRPPLPTLRERG